MGLIPLLSLLRRIWRIVKDVALADHAVRGSLDACCFLRHLRKCLSVLVVKLDHRKAHSATLETLLAHTPLDSAPSSASTYLQLLCLPWPDKYE